MLACAGLVILSFVLFKPQTSDVERPTSGSALESQTSGMALVLYLALVRDKSHILNFVLLLSFQKQYY